VRKAILGSLAPRRPWHQVVPKYSYRQDILRVKLVASRCHICKKGHNYADIRAQGHKNAWTLGCEMSLFYCLIANYSSSSFC